MKYSILVACLMASSAFGASFNDTATVVRVEENFRTIQVPRQRCSIVTVPVEVHLPGGSTTTTTSVSQAQTVPLGSVLAATAIGANIGYNWNNWGYGGRCRAYSCRHHSGSRTGAWIGGLLGFGMASSAGSSNTQTVTTTTPGTIITESRDIEQCQQVLEPRTVSDGFVVFYNYHGIEGSTKTFDRPGETIQITVDLTPQN